MRWSITVPNYPSGDRKNESLGNLVLSSGRLAGAAPLRHRFLPQRVTNKPDVNILLCASQRSTRAAMDNEVILDKADGLDWPTLCKCDLLHAVPKASLSTRRGLVTPERRTAIIRTINRANGWA